MFWRHTLHSTEALLLHHAGTLWTTAAVVARGLGRRYLRPVLCCCDTAVLANLLLYTYSTAIYSRQFLLRGLAAIAERTRYGSVTTLVTRPPRPPRPGRHVRQLPFSTLVSARGSKLRRQALHHAVYLPPLCFAQRHSSPHFLDGHLERKQHPAQSLECAAAVERGRLDEPEQEEQDEPL